MKKEKGKNFESYLKELESIVEKLESGEIDLEDAISDYEKGMALVGKCREILKETKLKIDVLKKKVKGGLETEPFEPEGSGKDKEEDPEEKTEKEDDSELPF